MREWISVEDALPEVGSYVWVFSEGRYIEIAKVEKGWGVKGGIEFCGFGVDIAATPPVLYDVTHWMPIDKPETPKMANP